MHFLLRLTDVNSDHCDNSIIQQCCISKREQKHFAYTTLRFSFFSSCEKNVFILDQLEAETKIVLTWHMQTDWMNERTNEWGSKQAREWTNAWMNERNEQTCRQFWSEISTTVKTLLQDKLTLVYAILGSFLPDTEQRLFCSLHFEVNGLPVPGLRFWEVTSAVMARFSSENMSGVASENDLFQKKKKQIKT